MSVETPLAASSSEKTPMEDADGRRRKRRLYEMVFVETPFTASSTNIDAAVTPRKTL